MSHRMLPLLYLNLGGEMMYIIDQRLIAQKIAPDKASKVLNDIASTMFNKKFIHEIFLKHTPLYSKKVLRAMFDRLAHASIMRLNAGSMDKLYDLMIMAVKHQVLMSPNPRHLIMVTLNHLDAMTDYATNPVTKKNIHTTYELLIQTYCGLSVCQLQWIRYAILNFLQDLRVRVSIFLQSRTQHQDGTFVYGPITKLQRGIDKPGTILFFDAKGEIMDRSEFLIGVEYEEADFEGGLGIHEIGNRGTKHGLNMYENSNSTESCVTEDSSAEASSKFKICSSGQRYRALEQEVEVADKDEACGNIFSPKIPRKSNLASAVNQTSSNYTFFDPSYRLSAESGVSGKLAREELNLLAKLIGTAEVQSQETFRINLFDPDMGAEEPEQKSEAPTETSTLQFDLRTDSSRRRDEGIDRIIGEMSLNPGQQGLEL